MWCPTCQSDVAAEVSLDHQQVCCANCQTELAGTATGSQPITPLQDAREILARWSSRDSLPSASTAAPEGTDQVARRAETAMIGGSAESGQLKQERPSADLPNTNSPASRVRTGIMPIPESDSVTVPMNEFHEGVDLLRVHEAMEVEPSPGGTWLSGVAQVMAFAGVGGMTVGTAAVIWGYFENISNYLPLGWLVLTFGQMMLFLGLITMVSTGMDDSRNRILGEMGEISSRLRTLETTRKEPEVQPRNPRQSA